MWHKLKQIHSKSTSNVWFNSLSDLFNICLYDGKSLTALCTHIEGTMQQVKALCSPAVAGPGRQMSLRYTLNMLNDELSTMAMLCALLCKDYASFILSVLLLNELTKKAVLEAFQTEEIQCYAAKEEAEINTKKGNNSVKSKSEGVKGEQGLML